MSRIKIGDDSIAFVGAKTCGNVLQESDEMMERNIVDAITDKFASMAVDTFVFEKCRVRHLGVKFEVGFVVEIKANLESFRSSELALFLLDIKGDTAFVDVLQGDLQKAAARDINMRRNKLIEDNPFHPAAVFGLAILNSLCHIKDLSIGSRRGFGLFLRWFWPWKL